MENHVGVAMETEDGFDPIMVGWSDRCPLGIVLAVMNGCSCIGTLNLELRGIWMSVSACALQPPNYLILMSEYLSVFWDSRISRVSEVFREFGSNPRTGG